MTGWRINDAVPADVRAMARIMGDWVRETGWMPVLHNRNEDEAFIAGVLGSHTVRVARNGEGLLGFLARHACHITAFYLADEARCQGIGRALIEEVKAVQPEIALWTFQANTCAVSFYVREGFCVDEKTDGSGNDEGLPDLRLIWRKAP